MGLEYDKDYIKNSLTIQDVFSLLEEFGANPTIHGGHIVSDTICHNSIGEGSKKLYYYDNTKLFRCLTGCNDIFDVFDLMVKIFDEQYSDTISLPKAITIVATKFGFSSITSQEFGEEVSEDWSIFKSYDKIKELTTKTKRIVDMKIYEGKILQHLPTPKIEPWIKEGISTDTMSRYGICYYPQDCQIVIPHYDHRSNLIGIRGRTMVQEDAALYGKYRPIIINRVMYNHPLGFALYGLNFNRSTIKIVKKAIIFESEKSVLKYDSMFGAENNISVACCGSSLSSHQFELLKDLGVEEIILCFDRQFKEKGDKEFRNLVKTLQSIASKYNNYAVVSCMFDKGDLLDYKASPIDHGKEVFLQMFKERITL